MRRYEEMEIKGPHRDAGDPARDRHGGRDPLAWLHLERRVDWPGAAQVLRHPGRRGLLHGDPAARLVPAGVPLCGPGPADLPAGPEQGAGRRGWGQLGALRGRRDAYFQAERRAPERPRRDAGHHGHDDSRGPRRRCPVPDRRAGQPRTAADHLRLSVHTPLMDPICKNANGGRFDQIKQFYLSFECRETLTAGPSYRDFLSTCLRSIFVASMRNVKFFFFFKYVMTQRPLPFFSYVWPFVE